MLALVTADAQELGTGRGAVGSLAAPARFRNRRDGQRSRIGDSLHVCENSRRVEAESRLGSRAEPDGAQFALVVVYPLACAAGQARDLLRVDQRLTSAGEEALWAVEKLDEVVRGTLGDRLYVLAVEGH